MKITTNMLRQMILGILVGDDLGSLSQDDAKKLHEKVAEIMELLWKVGYLKSQHDE